MISAAVFEMAIVRLMTRSSSLNSSVKIVYSRLKYDISRGVKVPCTTCLTWSNFILDKLEISIYLSVLGHVLRKLIKFCSYKAV